MAWTIESTLTRAQTFAQHLKKDDPEYVALAVLLDLGISTKRGGFYQLLRAIVLFCENPTSSLSKDIYPLVGQSYQPPEDGGQVEQTIRSAIQNAWRARDEEIWALYFPVRRNGTVRKPSNAEFISRIGWFVKLCQGCREVEYVEK